MRGELAVCVILGDSIHVRRRAFLDSVALQTFLGSDTPTIMHTVSSIRYISAVVQRSQIRLLHETNFVLYLHHGRKKEADVDGEGNRKKITFSQAT